MYTVYRFERSESTMRSSSVLRAAAAASLVLSFASGSSPALAQADAPGTRHLRLDECVDLALRNNVEVQSATEDVAASEASRAGSRGQIGPRVRVDAYAHYWDSPYNIPFGAAAFPVRDQFEWNATLSATQPITGLFAIFDAYKIKNLGVDIANIRRETTRRETAYRVVESYYHVLQGQRLVEVAAASVEQLQAQLKQSNSFHTNGVVSQDDVLRAQLAVANAQQRLIQMRSRISLEQARLAVLVGQPDLTIDPQPIAAGAEQRQPRQDAVTLDQAQKTAETQRVELVEVDKRIEQSDKKVKVAYLRLAPQVSVVGAYIHNEGSQFVQTNSAYVGAQATWDVWDWGTTAGGILEAKARARQAMLARTKISDQIRLEVRRAYLELTAASEAMVVAQASVASAEENFRLVRKRYDASAATSFDVIDAEGLLTQSRGQMQTAVYDQLVARAALRRAMGTTAALLARD
jgi:outer membrane protein